LAAVEFGLIIGPLALLMLAIFDLSYRFQAADEFERYSYQFGDILSRDDGLVAADLDTIHLAADEMMQQVDAPPENLDIEISSIGFQADGEPVLLWRRYRGRTPLNDVPLDAARDLAGPGETVIRVEATLRYQTIVPFLPGSENLTISRSAFFKPRVTRAISMDGDIHDAGVVWDNYTAPGV
ncbi:MAG: hypothetical protein AAFO63_09580, partial [Pseudomonadota bacterium]